MGWFMVTIILPVLAPMLLLPVYRVLPIPAKSKANARLVSLVKDGQLCWAALGFCVSALYEVAEPAQAAQALARDVGNWTNAGLIILLLFSAILASAGVVFPTPRVVPAGVRPVKHYSTMMASLVLTVLAGGAYTVVHFKVSSP